MYIYKGKNNSYLDDKICSIDVDSEITVFEFRNSDLSVGFEHSKEGIQLLKSISLLFTTTLLTIRLKRITPLNEFDKFKKIIRSDEFDSNINYYYAVSYNSIDNNIQLLLDEYEEYKRIFKKNKLLKRYGKPMIEIELARLFNYFINRKISKSFIESELCSGDLEYIICDTFNGGLFFFQPYISDTFIQKVIELCNSREIKVKTVSRLIDLPFY